MSAMSPSAKTPSEAAPTAAWDALARRAATGRENPEDAELVRELLLIGLGEDAYALPVERVREIVRMRAITPVPRVPEAVLGVISLRGEVVQVVDLRRRLGLPEAHPTRQSRIVLLHGDDGQATGLLIDRVAEVLRLPEEALRPPAAGESEAIAALCLRGEQFVSLLDVERVLDLDCHD